MKEAPTLDWVWPLGTRIVHSVNMVSELDSPTVSWGWTHADCHLLTGYPKAIIYKCPSQTSDLTILLNGLHYLQRNFENTSCL